MRSLWKGPYITHGIYTNLVKTHKKIYFLKKKNCVILPEFVNTKVKIYNGQKFYDLHITPEMVGYKFGFFIFTRKLHVFKTKR